ncbi:AfsR/SARP family transcriptional regulator, partial [Kineococcus indalonis]|uniref:AfsR/SARP family transcriptional regulator n=1 Tax=Kineococcus indalonis TaxID=2696566 RepID=UPI001411CB2A
MVFEAKVLGPVEAVRDGRAVALGSPKQRAVFALLVLNAGRVVPTERLVEELWGEHPPDSPSSAVQVYVSRLRRSLRADPPTGPPAAQEQAPVTLRRRGGGYQLDLPGRCVDAEQFATLVASGRELLAQRPADARQVLEEALALARGPALADVVATLGPTGAAEARRLDDLRLLAEQARLQALLAQGEAATAAADAGALVRRHPLQEDLRALHVLALYRSGRQAEALAAYEEVRRQLAEELGVDPGAALRALHDRVLRQDPALDPAPPAA